MSVTDRSRYARGDRDDAARAAATLSTKHWRVRCAHFGSQSEDAAPTRRRLKMLHRRISFYQMAQILPISARHLGYIAEGKVKRVTLPTAEAVEGLWVDMCAPVEKDRRRWPIEPLKKAVESRYGTVKGLGNTNMARQIWKGGDISTKVAEKYADHMGLLPVEIWGLSWYQD